MYDIVSYFNVQIFQSLAVKEDSNTVIRFEFHTILILIHRIPSHFSHTDFTD